jgi:hypothetical protein
MFLTPPLSIGLPSVIKAGCLHNDQSPIGLADRCKAALLIFGPNAAADEVKEEAVAVGGMTSAPAASMALVPARAPVSANEVLGAIPFTVGDDSSVRFDLPTLAKVLLRYVSCSRSRFIPGKVFLPCALSLHIKKGRKSMRYRYVS